jgi:hypothetical protein
VRWRYCYSSTSHSSRSPDTRPLSPSDISAANRMHDEAQAHSPWFQLWQRYGVCCRPESPVLRLPEMWSQISGAIRILGISGLSLIQPRSCRPHGFSTSYTGHGATRYITRRARSFRRRGRGAWPSRLILPRVNAVTSHIGIHLMPCLDEGILVLLACVSPRMRFCIAREPSTVKQIGGGSPWHSA